MRKGGLKRRQSPEVEKVTHHVDRFGDAPEHVRLVADGDRVKIRAALASDAVGGRTASSSNSAAPTPLAASAAAIAVRITVSSRTPPVAEWFRKSSQ